MKRLFLILLLIVVSGCLREPPSIPLNENLSLILEDVTILNGRMEDMRFAASDLTISGVNDPSPGAFIGGLRTVYFSPTTINEEFLEVQMPHSREANTTIFPHFHWVASTTNVGGVVWCMEYSWANIGSLFPAVSYNCIVSNSTGVINTHIMSTHRGIEINGSNKTYSSMMVARIYRNATDSRDTYTGTAGLLEFDIHYYVDKFGEDK